MVANVIVQALMPRVDPTNNVKDYSTMYNEKVISIDMLHNH